MDAKTMIRLDNINVVKQLSDNGYSVSEIATLLNLPESTVRAYKNN